MMVSIWFLFIAFIAGVFVGIVLLAICSAGRTGGGDES